ncbi:MAG TPA: hypothetical protein VHX38_08385, partial [Pseudonocardiaceae bacterium]|nr:hypothetical protein [Pseudonocardiaceae bacterium]
VLLTSEEPVVEQFLNGRRLGPIGMSEEKDAATMAREQADVDAGHTDGGVDEDISGIIPQLQPTPGLPERTGARRRQDRVMRILHTLPPRAQEAIVESLTPEEQQRYDVAPIGATASMHNAMHTTPLEDFRPSPRPRGGGAEQTQQFKAYEADHGSFRGDLSSQHVADLPESDWDGNGGGDGERGQEGS